MSDTTTKFTPGPFVAIEWDCDPRFNEDGNRYWGIKPEKFCTGVQYLEASGWMTEANARLIAAAPDMHAVCIAVDELFRDLTGKVNEAFLDRFAQVHFTARAALAKSRGEA